MAIRLCDAQTGKDTDMARRGGSLSPLFRTGPAIRPFSDSGPPASSASGPPDQSVFWGIIHYGRSILCMMEGRAWTGLSGRNFVLRLSPLKRGGREVGGEILITTGPEDRISLFHLMPGVATRLVRK